MFAALSAFRSWAGKRKRLLAGVVGVAVRSASACVPGVGLAAELLGQFAEKAAEDVFDPESKQPLSQEQLAQLNGWLEGLTRSYAGLLDRLEQLPLADHGTLDELTRAVETAIQGRDDLLRAFDGCLVEVRRQTLSLGLLERKLDEHFHLQQNLSAGLEEIKELLVRSPLMGEWATFRRARPEALQAVVEADEHFLAGRKDQGIAVLMGLLRQRGVGEATLLHQLGLIELSRGDPARARQHLRRATQSGQVPVPAATLAQLATMSGRGVGTWRSLPRLPRGEEVPHRGGDRPGRHGQRLSRRTAGGVRDGGGGRQGAGAGADARSGHAVALRVGDRGVAAVVERQSPAHRRRAGL